MLIRLCRRYGHNFIHLPFLHRAPMDQPSLRGSMHGSSSTFIRLFFRPGGCSAPFACWKPFQGSPSSPGALLYDQRYNYQFFIPPGPSRSPLPPLLLYAHPRGCCLGCVVVAGIIFHSAALLPSSGGSSGRPVFRPNLGRRPCIKYNSSKSREHPSPHSHQKILDTGIVFLVFCAGGGDRDRPFPLSFRA